MHGLEMRTELRFGNAADELARQLSESQDPLLILGLCDIARLGERFGRLLAEAPRWPVLIVYRPAECGRRESLAAERRA